MNLETKNEENLAFMISEISNKLQVVNTGAFQPESFDIEQYNDIKDLYEMVTAKDNISVSEMDAIVSELGNLKKN
nr:DUF1128 domain-containing protein [Bacillus sp. FJAT-44742]